MRAFPLACVLYCAAPLYLSHDALSPNGCYPLPPPPQNGLSTRVFEKSEGFRGLGTLASRVPESKPQP